MHFLPPHPFALFIAVAQGRWRISPCILSPLVGDAKDSSSGQTSLIAATHWHCTNWFPRLMKLGLLLDYLRLARCSGRMEIPVIQILKREYGILLLLMTWVRCCLGKLPIKVRECSGPSHKEAWAKQLQAFSEQMSHLKATPSLVKPRHRNHYSRQLRVSSSLEKLLTILSILMGSSISELNNTRCALKN